MYKENSCKTHDTVYRNGKTFEECKKIAAVMTDRLSSYIETNGQVSWTKIFEFVGNDELIYKLSLKYLRQKGYEIGNYKQPVVKKNNDTRKR